MTTPFRYFSNYSDPFDLSYRVPVFPVFRGFSCPPEFLFATLIPFIRKMIAAKIDIIAIKQST